MREYTATFFTHFGAMRFERELKQRGDTSARMIPCPRELSVSCGVAVTFTMPFLEEMADENTEAVYLRSGDVYQQIYQADEQ